MTGDPRLDAIFTLLVAPFIAACIALVIAGVVAAEWLDRRKQARRNPYLAPWADRKPGDICWCDGPDCGKAPCVEVTR